MGTLAIFFALYLQRKSQRTFEPNLTNPFEQRRLRKKEKRTLRDSL